MPNLFSDRDCIARATEWFSISRHFSETRTLSINVGNLGGINLVEVFSNLVWLELVMLKD